MVFVVAFVVVLEVEIGLHELCGTPKPKLVLPR